jgi:mRNA-degrading endonuclease RelE of RelBE toxin-antitoxin system
MITIAELPEYTHRVKKLLTEEEQHQLIDYLARHPTVGDLIQGTGGIRKLRWSYGGKGKRGGVRVIYYYHNQRLPLYLLSIYRKSDQDNLTLAQRRQLATIVQHILTTYLH